MAAERRLVPRPPWQTSAARAEVVSIGSGRHLLAILAFVFGLAVVPHRICERDADAFFDGATEPASALAASVANASTQTLAPSTFATGSTRFDGEWLFGTSMMAAMGFGQMVLAHPETRDENLARMERSLDALLAGPAREFDRAAWGEDALATLTTSHGHGAYLGYAGLALGLHRLLRPASRFAATDDAIVRALAARIEASPVGFIETYPDELYPVDNAAALAAIALHARATRRPPPPALARGLAALRAHGIDAPTGLVVQSIAADGAPRDVPRASGTALASYFLAFVDEALSRTLYETLRAEQLRSVLGFGAVRERPDGASKGDIDSGPVLFGVGVSATGFMIGASRVHGDRDTFAALYATAHLFGAPYDARGTRTYATGGPLGDAILFAMVTAPRDLHLDHATLPPRVPLGKRT